MSDVIVWWSLPISTPVVAAKGRSHIPSAGLRCSGLVQMAFWSAKSRRGVPAKVMSSGVPGAGFFDFLGEAALVWEPALEEICGSGASGKRGEASAVARS